MKKLTKSTKSKISIKIPHIFFFIVLILLVFVVLLLNSTTFFAAERMGRNLISNPTFDRNIKGWHRFRAGIKRNTRVYRGRSRRTKKRGSKRQRKRRASMYFPPRAKNRTINWIKKIKVTPGHYYTFRAYFRSRNVPSAPKLSIYSYSALGKRLRYQEEWFSVSKKNTWQEAVMEYRAMDKVSRVRLYLSDSNDTNAELWVDDVYFGEGRATPRHSSGKKVPFRGRKVRVDSRGNFEVNQNGSFKPFFPFGIMNTSLITSGRAQKFSNQGFNYSLGSNSSTLTNLKAAKSQYNPNGMMMMGSVLYHTGYNPGTIKNAVNNLKSSSSSDAILGWYYEPTDGNKKLSTYPQIKSAYNAIKIVDTDSPVFFNLGQIGYARALSNSVDVTGIFRYPKYRRKRKKHIPIDELGSGFKIASNLHGAKKPNSIATISATNDQGVFKPTPKQLRALAYHAIWGGAKGLMFWWEKQANGSKIDTTDLWPVFPVLRKEMQTILPIIRHGSAGFSVNTQTRKGNKRVDVLAKKHKGRPYLIVVNTERSKVKATFTFSRLSYKSAIAKEIFKKGDIRFKGNSFSLTLKPYATRVYRIRGRRNSDRTPSKRPAVSSTRYLSSKHPRRKNLVFNFRASDRSGISGYSYVFDKKPSTNPDHKSEGKRKSKKYSRFRNGVRYFHVKAVDRHGNWSKSRHYKIIIKTS